VALLSALGSAIGIIGVLAKGIIDARRNRNGSGHLTRDEFASRMEYFKAHMDARVDAVKEQVSARVDAVKDQVQQVQESQRQLRDEINPVLGRYDYRLMRLEDKGR
jgi:hypothetical protein